MRGQLTLWKQYLTRLTFPIVIIAGILLFLPSLDSGFYRDDFFHLALMEEVEQLPPKKKFFLYTFADGRSNRMGPVQGDFLPWWAADNLRLDFFRPLSCFTLLIDNILYGKKPFGYHMTSLILWALVLAVSIQFYRELAYNSTQSHMTVLLAALFFALDDAHVLSIFWIAHRHALIGTFFSIAAILQYHRYRRSSNKWSLYASLLLTSLGLASSEVAISVILWIIAYEICLSDNPCKERLRSSLPIMLLVLVYFTFYWLAGYGSSHSGSYINPLENLEIFIKASIERIPLLMMGVLTPVPADISLFPAFQGTNWPILIALGLASGFTLLILPHLFHNRISRFMALGALLSLLPQAATWPMNRLLMLPTVGTAWVFSSCIIDFMKRAKDKIKSTTRYWIPKVVATVFLVIHGLVAPFQSVILMKWYNKEVRWMKKMSLEAEIPRSGEVEGARVLLLCGPGHAIYLPVIRWAAGLPWPEAIWSVSTVSGDHLLKRTGLRSFSLRVNSPGFFKGMWERLFRDNVKAAVGDRFKRGALEVIITGVVKGEIREIELSLDYSLDSPNVWLLAWNGEQWVRILAPGISDPSKLLKFKDGSGLSEIQRKLLIQSKDNIG